MNKYTVTLELKTPWYKKVLRYFGFIKPREEFGIVLVYSHFKAGDILDTGGKGETFVKILKVEKQAHGSK